MTKTLFFLSCSHCLHHTLLGLPFYLNPLDTVVVKNNFCKSRGDGEAQKVFQCLVDLCFLLLPQQFLAFVGNLSV